MKKISAYNARRNFGEILNEVYYKGEEIVVEKMGRPMVKILPYKSYKAERKKKDKGEEERRERLMKYFGIWRDWENFEEVERSLREVRKMLPRKVKSL